MTLQQQEDLIAKITHKYKTLFRDEAQVNGLVAQYLVDNPIEGKTDAEVNALIEAYLAAHPVGGGSITVPITHIDQIVNQSGLDDADVRQAVNEEINANLGNRLQAITSVGNVYITNYITVFNETAPITNNTVWKTAVTGAPINAASWFVVNLFDGRFFVGQHYGQTNSYIFSVNGTDLILDHTFPADSGFKVMTPDGKRALLRTKQYDLQQDGSYAVTQTGVSDGAYQGYLKFDGLEFHGSHYKWLVQQDGTWANVGASVVTDNRDYFQCRFSPDASIVIHWVYSGEYVNVKELDVNGDYVAMPNIQIDTDLYRDVQKAAVTWDKQKAVLLVVRNSDGKYVLLTFYKRDDGSNEWDMVSVNNNQDSTLSNTFLLMSNDGSKVFTRSQTGHVVCFEQADIVLPTLDSDNPDPFGDGSLIHFYKLNGDATDSVGALNGTGEVGTYEEAHHNDGFTTDNADNRLDTGYSYTIRQAQSFAVWFKRSANGEHDCLLNGFIGGNQRLVGIICRDTTISLGIYDGTVGSAIVEYQDALNDGLWHHAVVASNGDELTVYVDNVLQDTMDITGITDVAATDASGNPDTLSIGWSGTPAYPYPYSGTVDHVQVFNRALTAEEVDMLFNATEGGALQVGVNTGNTKAELLSNNTFSVVAGNIPQDWVLETRTNPATNGSGTWTEISPAEFEYTDSVVSLLTTSMPDVPNQQYRYETRLKQAVTIPIGDYQITVRTTDGLLSCGYDTYEMYVEGIATYDDGTTESMEFYMSTTTTPLDIPAEETVMNISYTKAVTQVEFTIIVKSYDPGGSNGTAGVANTSNVIIDGVSLKEQ